MGNGCANKLPGIEPLPEDLTSLDAQMFIASVPTLVCRLRMRLPGEAWALNLSPASLDLLSRLLNEGKFSVSPEDHVVNGVNATLITEVAAYLGSTLAHILNGPWLRTPHNLQARKSIQARLSIFRRC